MPGQQFSYQFDDIGNRQQTQSGGDALGTGLRRANYSVNNLNQIMARDYPGTNDVIGAALLAMTRVATEFCSRAIFSNSATASAVRAGVARIFSSGARSTPRHCANTRWRLELPSGPGRGGVFFGGSFKAK